MVKNLVDIIILKNYNLRKKLVGLFTKIIINSKIPLKTSKIGRENFSWPKCIDATRRRSYLRRSEYAIFVTRFSPANGGYKDGGSRRQRNDEPTRRQRGRFRLASAADVFATI